MFKLKSLFKNINLLNIILIVFVLLMANYVVLPLLNMKIKYTPAAPKKISTFKEEEPAQSQIPSPSDYMIVAEQNLFHPERKIPSEKKEEQPMPKPEFVLYGTLITDDISLAYLEDLKAPRSTPGRGKRQTALKKGDTMSGYTLKDIETDKIVMTRGDDRIVIYVINPQKPKTREISAPIAQTAPRQPASTPPLAPSASTTQRVPAAKQPVKPPAEKKFKAPMTPAERRVHDFFQRQKR